MTNYASAVVNVPTTAPNRYLEYSLDSNGKLIHDPTTSSIINLNGVTNVGDNILQNAYNGNTNITGSINLSSVKDLTGNAALHSAFYGCTGITDVDFSSLQRLSSSSNGLYYTFYGCTNLTSFNLSSLVKIEGSFSCYGIFSNCTSLISANLGSLVFVTSSSGLASGFGGCSNLSSVNLSKICKLSNSCFANTFANCRSLTTLSFPNLAYTTTNLNTSFGNMLQGVTGCTVHFPAEWETAMSSWSNVTNGFGGTNTTVLFDLPNVATLDLSHITNTYTNNLFSEFGSSNYFPNITSVDLSNLETVSGTSTFSSAFFGCTGITSANLSSLTTITGENVFYWCFYGTGLTSFKFDSLKTITRTNGTIFNGTFSNCSSLTSVSFPALKTVSSAYYAFTRMLQNTSNVTVHFPSNLSGLTDASTLSGTNTTVLYDLPATNILTGADTVEYERNPKYDTATALAWRVNGSSVLTATPYYTSGTTDPAVSDTIYSDSACTTPVTTVSSIS